jgi:predicted RNA-binding protein with PIN domain
MRFLIDGYNLAHAMNLLAAKPGSSFRLESAREKLIEKVKPAGGDSEEKVTVVFDAARALPGARGNYELAGVRILFAQDQSADDLIEDLIHEETAPMQLTVVTDDRRILQAARRRGCPLLGCLDYLESRQTRQLPHPSPPPKPEKPAGEKETSYWLEQFGFGEGDAPVGEDFPFHPKD